MNLFKFFTNKEYRSLSTATYKQKLFDTKPKYSNQDVNTSTIVSLPTVNACIRLFKETGGVVPLITYQTKKDNSRERAKGHELYYLLKIKPNKYQTPSDFKEIILNHLMMISNAYIWTVKNKAGKITELIPLNPTRVKYSFNPESRTIEYFYSNPSSKKDVPLDSSEIIHIKINSRDGVIGVPLMVELRDAFANAMETEAYAARTMAGDATPTGIITYPTKVGEAKAKEIKRKWKENHNAEERDVAVLEGGMEFTPIQFSPQDAQFIESRKLEIENIARIFRAPPHLIGHIINATVGNSDVLDRQYMNYCLSPILNKIEEAINGYLFERSNKDDIYVEFKIEALFRGDPKAKAERDEIYIRNGVYSPNDIRRQLNENPRKDGDIYAQPTSPQQSANNQGTAIKSKPKDKQPDSRAVILHSIDEKFDRLITAVTREQRLDKIVSLYDKLFSDYCQKLDESGYTGAKQRSEDFRNKILMKMPTDERREKYIKTYIDGFAKFVLLSEITDAQKAREK